MEGNRIFCKDGEVYEGDNLEYVGFATGAEAGTALPASDRHFCPHDVYRALRRGSDRELRWRARRPSRLTSGRFPRPWSTARPGFRCRTLNEFFRRRKSRTVAWTRRFHRRSVAHYSHGSVKWRYQDYFRLSGPLERAAGMRTRSEGERRLTAEAGVTWRLTPLTTAISARPKTTSPAGCTRKPGTTLTTPTSRKLCWRPGG